MDSAMVTHSQTLEQLTRFLDAPVHAVLIAGPAGVGKGFVADFLATGLLQLPVRDRLETYPYLWRAAVDQPSISIDLVRELQKFLQLKTAGTQNIRRIAIIERAETMTPEAQNSLLKMLEEPPADTVIILTSARPRALLPTIHSRLQTIAVHAPEQTQLIEFFKEQAKSRAELTSTYFLSGGMPGLLDALLKGDTSHPLRSSVELAKSILQQTTFERLAQVDALAKQKNAPLQLLQALERIAQIGLNQAANKQDVRTIKRWHHVLASVFETQKALEVNANTKLALTHFMVNL